MLLSSIPNVFDFSTLSYFYSRRNEILFQQSTAEVKTVYFEVMVYPGVFDQIFRINSDLMLDDWYQETAFCNVFV